jgi:uncharacterized Fe-S cluster protein YjdI
MPEIIKEYKKGALIIVWKPEGASIEELVEQIKKCPSGALSYYIGEEIH